MQLAGFHSNFIQLSLGKDCGLRNDSQSRLYCLVPSAYVIMGHRNLSSTLQIFEGENDQHWNHMQPEDPYLHLATRSMTTENGSRFHPGDMSIDGVQCVSHWNPAARLLGHSSSSRVLVPHNQSDPSGPRDSFHPLATRNAFTVPEDHVHRVSSNYVVENNLLDLRRGPYKRKSPGVPAIREWVGVSGYYSSGSSSDASSSSALQQERQNLDARHTRWDHVSLNPAYRANQLSSLAECSMRNVRHRPAFELEADTFGTYVSGNYPHHSNSVDYASHNLTVSLPEWNHAVMPTAHGRTFVPETSSASREVTQFFNGNNVANVSGQMGGYYQDHITGRNPGIPQSSASTEGQTTRGIRSSHVHRSNPTSRVSVGSLHPGHAVPSDGGLQLVADSYSSRHPTLFTGAIGWHNSDRSGRSRLSSERYQSPSVDAIGHDQSMAEGLTIVDRSSLYGSRNLFDQHREMRLDIDNMSYEELLVLGERIGSVNTGLSEDLLPKCLTETLYCSLGQMQDEDRCIICLEEYQNMEEVGTLKACGHDYHVKCIKKWLTMKNLCPICKASALPDKHGGETS
ncbi:hypothetical protein Nepgr_024960 [Nepenthes gracilis]|uniref:RING-type E3 ubiquitin transferase n=1 Tax=Nepenthes gracilis TaxID=150966 RepID=A0AAD3T6X0_NEPGR|nr:hypothetical protein Nepgr_024960 [Nepenthes gracilis]